MRALGVDVSVVRGLDLVLMDDRHAILDTRRRVDVGELDAALRDLEPDAVAIDAPPSWGTNGGSRRTERELRFFGISSYGTPTAKRGVNPFYAWMKVGFRTFDRAARCGYRRYGAGPVKGTAIEVFPHASAVVLAGCLPPPTARKRVWRSGVLASQGVAVDGLHSADQVDAALAALTGILALRGRFSALGDPKEGVIVVPTHRLPAHAYRRCHEHHVPEPQAHLPGLSPCRCGHPECHEMTAGEFARGHDAKRKSALWAVARTGQDAVDELKERSWELPPEMR